MHVDVRVAVHDSFDDDLFPGVSRFWYVVDVHYLLDSLDVSLLHSCHEEIEDVSMVLITFSRVGMEAIGLKNSAKAVGFQLQLARDLIDVSLVIQPALQKQKQAAKAGFGDFTNSIACVEFYDLMMVIPYYIL